MPSTAKKQREYFYGMLTEEEKKLLRYKPTVNEMLSFAVKHYKDRPAISDGKNVYTYEETAARVAVRRGFLKNSGLGLGDKAAILSPNTADAMEMYLAVVTNGSVSVMLPASLPVISISGICQRFGVSVIFYDESLKDKAEASGVPCYSLSFEECGHYYAPAYDAISESVCSIFLSGDSLDKPEGAVMTHGAVMRGAFNGCFMPGNALYGKYIALVPFFHSFGLIRGFLSCLYLGGLIYGCSDIGRGIEMIPELKPTSLVLVRSIAEKILEQTEINGNEFSGSIKNAVIAYSPCVSEIVKEFDRLGTDVFTVYGYSEGANMIAGCAHSAAHPDSIGMIYPELQSRIVEGELRIKGDNLMLGYYADEKRTSDVFDDEGYLRTGDLIKTDEKGFIHITGRIKNLIVADNGEKISPEEIEEVFSRNDYIKHCRIREDILHGRKVIGIEIFPDERMLHGMTSDEKNSILRNVVKSINKELPVYKQVKKVYIRKEDTGKTNFSK